MRKLLYWQPKGNSCPCRVGSKKRRIIWSGSRQRSDRSRSNAWKSCKKWIEAHQELEAAKSKQIQAKHEMAMLVAEQTAENAKKKKLSIKEIQDFRITRQDPFLIKLHNKPFSLCSNPFSRCKAWPRCATEDDVKKISQVMAQTMRKLENWNAPEPGPEVHSILCEVVGSDEEFSNGICVFGFSKMDTEGQEAIKRSLSNAIKEKRRLAKKCKQEGEGWKPAPSLDLDPLIAVSFYLALSRSGEADNPGLAHATAKLFGDQFEAIGQWTTNLTSKSEVELAPLLAQVGECRQLFGERL